MTDPPSYQPGYGVIMVDVLDVYELWAAPRIFLDGVKVPRGRDIHSLPVPSGYHRIEVHLPATGRSKSSWAETVVHVHRAKPYDCGTGSRWRPSSQARWDRHRRSAMARGFRSPSC